MHAGHQPLGEWFDSYQKAQLQLQPALVILWSLDQSLLHPVLESVHGFVPFVFQNSYMDTAIQKAFVNGIPGCAEHHCKLAEVI